MATPRILLLQLEFPTWHSARSWSYAAGLGMEEGLLANGVDCLTITTPWFNRAREICAGKQFDQVWFDIARHESLDDSWLEWVSGLAPIRLGWMAESLCYTPDEWSLNPELRVRRAKAENRMKFATHVLAVDETDAERVNSAGLPAMWWPQAVPRSSVFEAISPIPNSPAFFSGQVYGRREAFVGHPELSSLMQSNVSPENETILPMLFDGLHLAAQAFVQSGLPRPEEALAEYMLQLRYIRREAFKHWLRGFDAGSACVNLPSLVKAFAGRVFDAMAAGRPVISWDIPNRPRTRALFEEGKEILFFSADQPAELAAHIRGLLHDPARARHIAVAARERVRAFHTLDHRAAQILNWIDTGTQPAYA